MHFRQQILKAKAISRLLHPAVQIPHSFQGNKFIGESGQTRNSRHRRQHFRLWSFPVQLVCGHVKGIAQALCGSVTNRLNTDEK
jgi:hypothetical protein